MHSSDETGDERKGLATTGGAAAEGDPAKLPAHAFRERIRRASVAAAQSSVPPSVNPNAHLSATDVLDASSSSSLLPPEQSGVHDRKSDEPASPEPEQTQPDERADNQTSSPVAKAVPAASPSSAAASSSGFEGAVASGLRRPTPPAWPFAGGTRDDRRPHYHTQLGLGLPQRTALPSPKSEASDSEMSDARRRMDTRDTKRSGAAQAHPNAKPAASSNPHKITPARPFRAHDAAKWSPTSTRPQRASLLRGDSPKSGAATGAEPETETREPEQSQFSKTLKHGTEGEPSIQVDIASSLDVGRQSEVSRLAAAPLDPVKYSKRLAGDAKTLDGAAKPSTQKVASSDAANGGEEDDSTRARRYTPKQRPTQRRGRGTRAGSAAEASQEQQDHQEHQEQQEAPQTSEQDPRVLAVTVPDLRIPGSARPPALPLSPGAASAFNVTTPGIAQVVTPDTPTQPRGRAVPRLPFAAPPPSAFSPPAAFSHSPAFSHQPPFSPRPDAAFKPSGQRPPFPPAVTQRDRGTDGSFAQHEASIVVDPTLHGHFTEVHPSQLTEAPSGYQPLPSDPAAFEQMMREQAAARGSRLNWKQQATLVIPRESLEPPEERRFINPKVVFGFLAASAAGALLMLGISQFGDQGGALRVATDTSTSAAHAAAGSVTVIATEPSGAELLLDGAVVGNTPLEVVRPPRGQGEHTYVLRLRGFTQELVRLGSDSQPAIRVTLTPESGVP